MRARVQSHTNKAKKTKYKLVRDDRVVFQIIAAIRVHHTYLTNVDFFQMA